MKNKKFILLILVIILFSGCSVEYNLTVNEDLTVNEKVVASESKNVLKTRTGQDPKTAANSLYEYYKNDGVKYKFSTVVGDADTKSYATTSYKSLEDYENRFKSDIVKEANITKKDSYITIEYKQDVPLDDYASRSLIYDRIAVNIDVPFKVTKNNADSVKGNTYTWNIEKNGELKDIKITFNTKETNTSRRFDLGFLEINVSYTFLLIAGIAVIVLIIVLIVYSRNKKNNIM
jgi:hypothetical protein